MIAVSFYYYWNKIHDDYGRWTNIIVHYFFIIKQCNLLTTAVHRNYQHIILSPYR